MNATQQAMTAYGKTNSSLRTPRGIEYEVFAQVTRQFQNHLTRGEISFPKLVEALHQNRKLWIELAADVADEGNRLSQSVRSRVFYLCEFTKQHTSKVLAGDSDIGILAEINLSMMRGLSVAEDLT